MQKRRSTGASRLNIAIKFRRSCSDSLSSYPVANKYEQAGVISLRKVAMTVAEEPSSDRQDGYP